MKEITAVIRMNMLNKTKRALAEIDVPALTAHRVDGRGKGNVDYLILKGAEEGHEEAIAQLGRGPKLIPKRMLTIVVPDDRAEQVIRTIIAVNQTGNAGDGKIFVQSLVQAFRIRTGDYGEEAIL
ncbi:MAG: P-II family nitrogen regulator [Chloroflexota bacterium]|nr:MAG: P-II family nitrogen regulator [Chloroflexota bacterium]